ncbi:unnamed protein product [Linum trigynum]|uniref:Integrase catalytic domain-containing protein n=1 Tax=Linum trigynum TaxID=586398 RepID=A0AAV2E8F0_9ROSI
MAEGEASDSAEKEVPPPPRYEDPYSNPFYLAQSDNSFLPVIGFKLTDDNYLLWSESMEVALRTKNKLGFVLGTIQVPPLTDPSYGTWDRVNGTVVCWIRNSVSEDIVPSLRNIGIASEAWTYLKSKFSQGDSIRIANLQEKIDLAKQGNQTVRQYFTNLKLAWDELKTYQPIPYCDCAAGTYATVMRYEERGRVIRFLLGLNEKYQQVKTQMLMLDPLPDLDSIYRSVVQLERQLDGASANTGKSEEAIALATALAASRTQYNQPKDKGQADHQPGGLFCRYCKKEGHVKEDCWKLKRKNGLLGNNPGRGNNAGRGFAGSVDVNTPEGNPSGGAGSYSPTSPVSQQEPRSPTFAGFTVDELTRLKALLQPASSSHGSSQANAVITRSQPMSGILSLSTLTHRNSECVWVLDTGASDHIICSISLFLRCKKVHDVSVTLPNSQQASVTHLGVVKLPCGIFLTNVLLVPSFSYNLISISQLTKNSPVSLLFQSTLCSIQDLISRQRIGLIPVSRGLYLLGDSSGPGETCNPQIFGVSTSSESSSLWHKRLGHLSLDRLRKIKQTCTEVELPNSLDCEFCHLSRQKRLPFPRSTSYSKEPFDLIHCDIWGPVNVVSHDGFQYFLTVVDDHSRCTWLYLMSHKSEVKSLLQSFFAMVETQFSRRIKVLRSDQGQEFKMVSFYQQKGCIHEMSCIHTAQQNGRVERKHQHILNVARALKFQSGLPVSFWSHFVMHAIYLINRTPTPVLHNKSPFEILFSIPPDYSNLRVFGCLAFATNTESHKPKFAPRAVKAVFLGYTFGVKGFKLYDLATHSVFTSRDVEFNESEFPFLPSSDNTTTPAATSSPIDHLPPFFFDDDLPLPQDHNVHETSDPDYLHSPSPSPVPSPPASPIHTPPPAPPLPSSPPTLPIALRKAPRVTRPPKHLDSFHTSFLTEASSSSFDDKLLYPLSHNLSYSHLSPSHRHYTLSISMSTDPQTYAQAALHPCWNQAMKEEVTALEANETWDIVDRPPNVVPIGCKWVYKTKFLPDGAIERFKAKVVAKGYTQTYGIDFVDTFSPVAKINYVKLLLAIAAAKNWHLHQMDVSNAFLNGDLEEEIYMELPPGLRELSHLQGKVCRLKKSLYGLKQASRQWYLKLTEFLTKLGFQQSYEDYSVFKTSTVVLVIYVDDIIVAGPNLEDIQSVKTQLQKGFKVKDLGNLKYFLGLEIARTQAGISLCQRKFCLEMLENADFLECKPAKTPISMKATLSAEDGTLLDDGSNYRHLLGQLQYLTSTRPDICFPVQQLSQFQDRPTTVHLKALHRILRYLKGCPAQGLWFSSSSSLQLSGYCDSDWATCPDSRKSITGYCTFLGSSLITWKSKKQSTVSRSSSKAEYRAMAQLACQVQWLKAFLNFFGIPHSTPVKVYCDNQSAIHIAENPVYHERTKHIKVDCHVVRERLKSGLLNLFHLNTENQLADLFTNTMFGNKGGASSRGVQVEG